MYKAELNNEHIKTVIQSDDGTFNTDGSEYKIERVQNEIGIISVKNGKSQYLVKIQNEDNQNKVFKLRLNGIKHSVKIKDKFDLLLDDLGFDSKENSELNQLIAPMPGLILEINVSPGDKVKIGDKLVVLEAMKMENSIKSRGEGTVKEIKVKIGESVEKNRVMIQF
jgi:biotin carboxyl carrier protein